MCFSLLGFGCWRFLKIDVLYFINKLNNARGLPDQVKKFNPSMIKKPKRNIMKRIFTWLILFCLISSGTVFAQSRTITGKITAKEDGLTLSLIHI